MYLKFIAFLAVTFLGIGCAAAHASISTTVDAQGFFRDPFYLVPMGYLFLCAGLGGMVITAMRAILARMIQPHHP